MTKVPESKVLIGKKQIQQYTKRGWRVIQQRIDNEGFPAKFMFGAWEAHTDAVDKWTVDQYVDTKKEAP